MRSTVNIRGDLEKYIQREAERTGMTVPNIIVNLAVAGMEYRDGLRSFSVLAAALENMGDSKGELESEKEKI